MTERRGRWLALAALLHGGLWAVIALRAVEPYPRDSAPNAASADEIEITELAAPTPPTEVEASVPAPPAAGTNRGVTGRATSTVARAAAEPVADAELVARADGTSSDATPLEPGATEPEASAPPAPLSLDALGVGPQNPFVSRAAPAREAARPRESARAQGEARFRRSLAADIVRADQSHGLGPEGPVLSTLENIVRVGDAELNSTARFRFMTDAEGLLLRVELLSSSSDQEPWRRHGQAVLAALRAKKLRVPKTGRGVTFDVRVESRVQLPSGADPGMEVTVLGIPVKKGQGPRSARMEILNVIPKLETAEGALPSGERVVVPKLAIPNIFSLGGDLSDIGAKAQRMVHAHLEKITAN